MSINDLLQYKEALEEKFGTAESIAYANISRTQLSIARYAGGAKVQGKYFIYNPTDDSLIREDVLKFIAKLKKEEKKKCSQPQDSSPSLF